MTIGNKPFLFPKICAELLATGYLTPLNKLSQSERKAEESLGLPPKLRPINAGTMIAKLLLSEMLASPAGQRAASRTAPFQLALGVSRGCEKLAHICRAAHETGWLVAKNDFTNGFNCLSRQAMLDSHNTFFPESTNLFNFFYSVDAPIFLFDSESNLVSLTSKQGPRQGCSAGTEAFCFTIHPLLVSLKAKYPTFEFRVLTDDIVPLCPPPADPSPDAWQTLYRLYAAFLMDLQAAASQLGLKLNAGKCAILLPSGSPLPDESSRALFPPGFSFSHDGIIVAGAPIGTDIFIANVVETKFYEAKAKLAAIEHMGKKCPRSAHRLLSSCVTKLMCHVSSTVPPHLVASLLNIFDLEIRSTFFKILSPNDPAIICGPARTQRATIRCRLPTPLGCGLFSASDAGAISWWSSVQACLSDELLFHLRLGLSRFVEPAWHLLTSTLGGIHSPYWLPIAHLVPPTSTGLLDGSMFFPGAFNKVKLNKVVLNQVNRKKKDLYNELTAYDNIGSPEFSTSDYVVASSRSLAGKIFAEPFTRRRTQSFSNESYIAFCRFFLGLPPATTVGDPVTTHSADYPLQRCLVHPGAYLDASACHAAACTSAFSARSKKHNQIARILAAAAAEAQLEYSREPDTYGLLLSEFSKSDCRRIFPKKTTAAYKTAFKDLLELDSELRNPRCPLSEASKAQARQACIDTLPITDKKDVTGLRIDLAIVNSFTGETQWIDVTSVNTAAPSCASREIHFLHDRQRAAAASASLLIPAVSTNPSPSLEHRESIKKEKYSRLVCVASRQADEGKRQRKPAFTPFAMSSTGDFGPEAWLLLEWLVNQYRQKCSRESTRPDGFTTKELTADFRHRLIVDLQFAMAIGNGNMICKAGLPFA